MLTTKQIMALELSTAGNHMSITALTKDQWISVVKNAVIAGAVAFLLSLQYSPSLDKDSLYSATIAAGVAIVKIVEKLFTEA